MPERGKNQLSHQIAHVLQDLAVWDTLSSSECKEIALFVAASLPPAFHFARIETYGAGQQRHHMALFEWQESSQQSSSLFVLIPGSAVTLGYDQTRISIPDEQFIREWLEYLEDGEVERAIRPADVAAFSAHVKEKLLPPRTTTLQPFLLETVAQEASLLLPPPVMTYHRFKAQWQQQVPVKYFLSDPYRQWSRLDSFDRGRYHVIPHRHVVAFLKQQGFRLPSSDEWEYACAAGSHTLFYWGNWEFLMGENAPVPYALPNAFGLSIANNPYQREYCSDPTVMRGGDGGEAFCGAEGELASHLPLASAYVYYLSEEEMVQGAMSARLRRVLDLVSLFE